MKKIKIFFQYILLLAFVTSLSASAPIGNDCDDEDFLDDCAELIDGYKFLKANKVNITGAGDNREVEISSVFSTGSVYILTACSGSLAGMKITLYDRKKKRIMTNYDANRAKNAYYPSITFKCNATGVYYLKYEFEGGRSGCGVGIIGFKKGG